MSTAILTAEIAELRQVVRDLVVLARDVAGAGGVDPTPEQEAAALDRLRRACDRAERRIGGGR